MIDLNKSVCVCVCVCHCQDGMGAQEKKLGWDIKTVSIKTSGLEHAHSRQAQRRFSWARAAAAASNVCIPHRNYPSKSSVALLSSVKYMQNVATSAAAAPFLRRRCLNAC